MFSVGIIIALLFCVVASLFAISGLVSSNPADKWGLSCLSLLISFLGFMSLLEF